MSEFLSQQPPICIFLLAKTRPWALGSFSKLRENVSFLLIGATAIPGSHLILAFQEKHKVWLQVLWLLYLCFLLCCWRVITCLCVRFMSCINQSRRASGLETSFGFNRSDLKILVNRKCFFCFFFCFHNFIAYLKVHSD